MARPLQFEPGPIGLPGYPWWVGVGPGVGSVPGWGSLYAEVGREPLVVLAADGDEVIDVGGATVAVPFLDVVKIASVHGGAAFEAASVTDRDHEALGCVGEALVAAQPERATRPVEDHAGQLGVGGEGLEDLAWYRSGADDLDLAFGISAVHDSDLGGEDQLGWTPWP